jgi:hypothetical protein
MPFNVGFPISKLVIRIRMICYHTRRVVFLFAKILQFIITRITLGSRCSHKFLFLDSMPDRKFARNNW